MKIVEKTGKTVEEAINAALAELNVTKEQTEIEVLEEPGKKGIFGLFGAKDARVKVSVKETAAASDVIAGTETGNTAPVAAPRTVTPAAPPDERAVGIALDFLRQLTEAMEVEAEFEKFVREDSILINITGQELGILIGRHGDTLDAMQFLANLTVSRKLGIRTRIVIDVEGYRRRREETLVSLAQRLADKVKRTGSRVVLEPMNPQERRIIHTALQNEWKITTFSEGEEPQRRVVIAPKRGGS